ncbi:glutathione S-transferase-like [Quillaja saponaria]|uniref:glutathione transferase n=1 Tax=Quillaja saponaria TaxID=32244 RepID=A0AAD7LZ55_QUISA|nr:glutathione S-transferase-like [Quillaja saponaria]
MATGVKVYGPPDSTAVTRVLACLLEKDVEFQVISFNMFKGEHKNPDYLKIQPFGQVPAFEDENITLFESRAICRYVCEKHADKGNRGLYGTNPLVKASIDQWLEVEGHNFNPPSSSLIYQLVLAPMMKIEQDQEQIKQNEDKLAKVLDVYDKWLGDNQFLAGDEFSLADLSHLPNTQYLVGAAEKAELFTSRKNVARWWGEISNRDSWKRATDYMQNSA